MPYCLYLGILYNKSDFTSHTQLSLGKQFLRIILLGLLIGTAYIPYLLFMGVESIVNAMLLTVVLPLGGICFCANAFFERLIYQKLGLSFYYVSGQKKE